MVVQLQPVSRLVLARTAAMRSRGSGVQLEDLLHGGAATQTAAETTAMATNVAVVGADLRPGLGIATVGTTIIMQLTIATDMAPQLTVRRSLRHPAALRLHLHGIRRQQFQGRRAPTVRTQAIRATLPRLEWPRPAWHHLG